MPRFVALLLAALSLPLAACAADQVPITVKAHQPGAPITVGLPFPMGALHSPDHVRVLTAAGREIPSQITEVTTWAPADPSLKWIWVFFFADDGDQYTVEYGADVQRARYDGPRVQVINSQRPGGGATVNTGPLAFEIPQGGLGFIDEVDFDHAGDGLGDGDRIAGSRAGRGSFLDLLDDEGLDPSGVTVLKTFKERGSGPLHAIVRVEGTYQYGRADNNPAPFEMYIHAYAGRPFVRVLHTFTYTGVPDQYPRTPGEQHAAIATKDTLIVDEEARMGDPRWQEPEDQIAAAGLSLQPYLDGAVTCQTGYRTGEWWDGTAQTYTTTLDGGALEVVQTGPDVYATSGPEVTGGPDARIDPFEATITAGGTVQETTDRADGWLRCADETRGVAVGLRHFFEEFPSALTLNPADSMLTIAFWPEQADPMKFTRFSLDRLDGGLLGNYAQGLAKTSEAIVHFFAADESADETQRVLDYVLDPPVAHAPPQWYAASGVYGTFAPASEAHPEFERSLEYKFDWWRFNQQWEPWYGLFNYGDGKAYYFRNDWYIWLNNEPASDFMWWLQFMRTGDRQHYLDALATSRHTMDVDNIHWPQPAPYYGDTNPSLDAFRAAQQPPGTPYLGIGRRHGWQQWTAILSAHVWVQGWLASYYLAGEHRGLDAARLTADTYLERIWGEHDLLGRRLYLSVWNLAEVWDATKDPRYAAEVADRVDRMLTLQRVQGDNLLIDRYGYSQSYATHGLSKVYQLTGDPAVREALVRHARHVRDNPPLNHEMESFLASIHPLLVGYEHTGITSFLDEAVARAEVLKVGALPDDAFATMTQGQLKDALEGVSNLPGGDGGGGFYPNWRISNGLRIFGWTHIYNVPWLLHWLQADTPSPELPASGGDD
ncbi:MAG: hypothetical protein AAGI71_06990 [Bacteroidota bacterium]